MATTRRRNGYQVGPRSYLQAYGLEGSENSGAVKDRTALRAIDSQGCAVANDEGPRLTTERPVFIPVSVGRKFVDEVAVSFKWHPGMAASQKKKNVAELHGAAHSHGLMHLLEISSKSDLEIGRRLSAFHQKVQMKNGEIVSLECAFQGSKVFEFGGPYVDLFQVEPREAKQDARLKGSGKLIRFEFDGRKFPLSPKSVFYDWLYANAIFPEREWLRRLDKLDGFTDIEFNPEKSVNCQARSCAFFVALEKRNLLDQAMVSFENFADFLRSASF